ncbi:hypothetical protein ACE1SV_76080 [Streptomyces sennicomposti]
MSIPPTRLCVCRWGLPSCREIRGHYSATGADPAAHIRAITAAGLAYVICSADAERLGRCARRDCALAFVDTSRNGRRAYCSVRCANNDAVARHRERRHGNATPTTSHHAHKESAVGGADMARRQKGRS